MTEQGYGVMVVGGVFNSPAPSVGIGQQIPLQLDAAGNVLVNIAAGGGGGGTQYTDGTTQATPVGTVALGKNPSNILHALAIDASGNLNVNIAAGGGTGGGPADVGLSTAASETDTGRQKVISALRLWDQIQAAGSQLVGWRGDTTSGAWVNIKAGNVQFADNAASGATPTGTLAMGWDAGNSKVRALTVSATQALRVDTTGGAVTANQGSANSIGNSWPVEVTDGSNILGTAAHPLRIDPTGTTTQPVSIAANVGVTQQTTPWTIQGDSASGAAKAGNPVQVGGVFNTTQPTVTTGQTVEGQYTARGAAIVATGVDAFNVTLTSTTITGTVAVTQSTSPWVTSDNHYPAAVALADNLVNPTTTEIGANLLGWDATNSVWRRVQVDAGTGTLKVDGSGSTQPVSGTVSISGNVGVTQQTSPWVDNLTQVAGVALGATAVTNFGTAPAAAAVPGVNASLFSGTTGLTNTSGALDINIKSSGATVTVAGTVTANQGGAPWTVKPDGTVWTLTGTSANVNVTNNVGVTQQTSPWVDNVSQFGGNNVVTGTGLSGAGIPRVTVSSDSFPASQTNGALETGGNLDMIRMREQVLLMVLAAQQESVFSTQAPAGFAPRELPLFLGGF